MLRVGPPKRTGNKAIAMTSFGVTTPCVDRCVELLHHRVQHQDVLPHGVGQHVAGGHRGHHDLGHPDGQTPVAAGNVLPYTMGEDILMLNTVVDVQNLNFMSSYALRQAAGILDSMPAASPRR